MEPHASHRARQVPSPTSLMLFVLGVAAATLVLSLVQTPYYRSRVRILLVQQYGAGMDPYNISKATEYYTNLLAEVVGSRTFFNEVMSADPRIQQNFFPTSPEKRERLWHKLVGAQPVGDTGILTITVYHPSRLQAESLASAIAEVFASKGALFHGVGDRITIRTIDDPVTSEKPVSPILWLNVLIAFIVASGAAVVFRMHTLAKRHERGKVNEEEYFLR